MRKDLTTASPSSLVLMKKQCVPASSWSTRIDLSNIQEVPGTDADRGCQAISIIHVFDYVYATRKSFHPFVVHCPFHRRIERQGPTDSETREAQ